MTQKKNYILFALIPIVVLLGLLALNVKIYEGNSSSGPNQIALLFAAFIAAIVGIKHGFEWKHILKGIIDSISTSMQAIIILLLIGALSGTWLISGVVPAMIYYGLDILQPSYFLVAACIISSIISLASGSSWSTIATVGIALLAIGKVLGFSEGWIAGAVISGAYFGDKMSPLSDTTNLAPAMAGTDLITHIRYMALTTIPSISISLIVFLIYGWTLDTGNTSTDLTEVQSIIAETFNINISLFLVPAIVVTLIVKKVKAIPALFIGVLAGVLFAIIFQGDVIHSLIPKKANLSNIWSEYYYVMINSMSSEINIVTENDILNDLLSSSGMEGMLNTVWLIMCAMIFSGVLESTKMLEAISQAILKRATSETSLITSTVFSCIFFNTTASDQYLAIVVPGKMFSKAYKDKGLAPENLSRSLEDSGTVTSVLIPWNTCGRAQSGILGVETWLYLPYCIFNWISPIMTIIFALFKIKIARLKESK